MLTGIGGAGKSTLATRLARKLEGDGFTPIAISSTETSPLTSAQMLQSCGDAFLKAGLNEAFATLNNPQIPVDARLRFVVGVLNEHRFVLVLDNFEVNLDETTRRAINPEVAELYSHLLANLVGDSRAFITCRYLPAAAALPRTAHEEPLGDFPETQFVKLLLREPELEKRYYAGDLPKKLLQQLHELLGGTPRFLLQMREAIKSMTTADLWQELAKVKLPDAASLNAESPGKLQQLREQYCQSIFTARLFGYLSEDSRRALCRAAVFGVPVNLTGLGAVSGESETRLRDFTRQWQDYALAFPEREKAEGELWAVYGLLRGWMLSPERLSEADRLAAHKAAGDFLWHCVKQKRSAKLGLLWVECLAGAREQYLKSGDYQNARDVTYSISSFLAINGLNHELIRLNEEILAYEEHPVTMNWIGRGYSSLAFYHVARSWYERALTKAGLLLPNDAATALIGLASIDYQMGDYKSAREKFQASLPIFEQIANSPEVVTTLNNLAVIEVLEGNYPAAREHLRRTMEITQQIGDREGEASTWHQLASIDLNEGNYPAAREKFNRSLDMRQQIGNRVGEAATLHQLATIDLNEGNYTAARELFQRVLTALQQIGDRAGEAATLHNLATIDLNKGNYMAAGELFQRALTTRKQIGDRAGEAQTFYQIGNLAYLKGKLPQATRLIALSFNLYQAIGHNDAKMVAQNLEAVAEQLNYTPEQVQALLAEVAQEYARDRGAGLVRAAFGEE